MEGCEHKITKSQTVHRVFRDKRFEAVAEVCQECGAEIWTEELSHQFQKWVGKQENVRIQFKLSPVAKQCLHRLVDEVPTSKPITLAKVLILTYSVLYKSGKGDIFNKAYESEKFITFEDEQGGSNFGFDVHPLFFQDIESLSKIHGNKVNEMAWDALHIMLSICFSSDVVLKKYWDEEVLPKLQDLLKVA